MIKILSGDDYQIKVCKQTVISDFLRDNDALSLEEIDIETQSTFEVVDLLSILTTISFFNPCKLVILKNLKSKPNFQNNIKLILSSVVQGVSLLIIEPKIDKGTIYGQFLKKHDSFVEYKPYKGRELEDWLVQQAASYESKLERRLAVYLIEKVGSESLLLDTELQKLRVYPVITQKLIDDLVVPGCSSQIFELLDALLRGQLNKALGLYYDQRRQKNEPIAVLGLFIWQLRILIIAKHNLSTPSEATSQFKISPYAFKKAQNLVRQLDTKKLDALVELCHRTDSRIRLEFIDPDEAFLFFIFRGCQLVK